MKCLFLAAGYATRLYPLTENFPKPLLEVGGKTILDHLIADIDRTGLVDEYLVVSNAKFAPIFEKWARKGIRVISDGTWTNETRLGAVKDIKSEPGLYFKAPFVQSVTTLPKTVLLYDLPISDVITADKHSMVLDSFTMWRISDPRLFIESLSGSLTNAESRINANVYNALKTVISSQNQEAIISGRDGLIVSLVMQNIGSSFDRYGIEILAVETKTLDLPDDNKDAVYTRMISERNNIAASYTAEGNADAKQIRNAADREVQVLLSEAQSKAETIRAEGDAEYMRILSEVSTL